MPARHGDGHSNGDLNAHRDEYCDSYEHGHADEHGHGHQYADADEHGHGHQHGDRDQYGNSHEHIVDDGELPQRSSEEPPQAHALVQHGRTATRRAAGR